MPESHYFFLSYARSDYAGSIRKFFDDLSAEVREFAGVAPSEDVGFLDVDALNMGEAWSDRLVDGLVGCRTFVALVSPRYQVSEPCGREWSIFADRLRRLKDRGEFTPPAIFPVLWTPTELHPVVRELQYTSGDAPDAYRRIGLRQLIRLNRNQDDYLHFVTVLAEAIVKTARHEVPAPQARPDYHRTRSVFHADNGRSGQVDQVRFVVAAPSRAELTSPELVNVGREESFYGERPLDWAPFRPVLDLPVGEFARTIAEERSFQAVVSDDVSGLDEWLDEARSHNQVVILLVDPWATRLRSYRLALAECDLYDAGEMHSIPVVMVPANHRDGQTVDNLRQLMDSLRAIMYRRSASGDDLSFRTSILSHEAFDADLRVVLERSRNRIFNTGPVQRRPPGPAVKRPILRGP